MIVSYKHGYNNKLNSITNLKIKPALLINEILNNKILKKSHLLRTRLVQIPRFSKFQIITKNIYPYKK